MHPPRTCISKTVQYRATNTSPLVQLEITGIVDNPNAVIDSGSSANFINITYTRKHHLPLIELSQPKDVIGIQGKELPSKIHFKVWLKFSINGHNFEQRFLAMPLGETAMVLGMTWLRRANPAINWAPFEVDFKETAKSAHTGYDGLPRDLLRDFTVVFDKDRF